MERFFVRCDNKIFECEPEDWCFQYSPYQLARSYDGVNGIVLEFTNPNTKLDSVELLVLIALVWEEGTPEKEQIVPETDTVTCAGPESSES